MNEIVPAQSLGEWFLAGLRSAPDGVALRLVEQEWSYTELYREALRVAGAVQSAGGDGPAGGPVVGLLAAHSFECYAGLLGTLFAGGVLVPLNPSFPPNRTISMARAAGVNVVIADEAGGRAAADLAQAFRGLPVVAADPEARRLIGPAARPVLEEDALPAPVAGRSDTAYILFTSGSTGRPKGVPVTHQNIAHFLAINHERYRLTPADVCSQTFDITFDLAMFDLFMAWGAGATVVSTPPQAFWSQPDFVRRAGLTVWFSVPSAVPLFRRRGYLAPGSLPTLRWSLFCGEPLPAADALDWQRAANASVLENLYGPTELTIACSAYRFSAARSPAECVNGIVPIGTLYPGLDHVLTDTDGQRAAGEGELCVRGPQMFPGYLDSADDAGRFHYIEGARYYRTGDLVRATPAGFAFVGRVDHQIKIGGYRIELPEIESCLRAVPGVDAAVVVTVDTNSSRRLAAFYTGTDGLADRLRDHLLSAVPEYMIPNWIRHVDDFPLNPNRKIDRAALTETACRLIGISGAEVR